MRCAPKVSARTNSEVPFTRLEHREKEDNSAFISYLNEIRSGIPQGFYSLFYMARWMVVANSEFPSPRVLIH